MATIQESQRGHAIENGNAFNVNTGIFAITTGTTALLYFKNDQPPVNGISDFLISDIAIGIGTISGTITDPPEVNLIINPTGGDIITTASEADVQSNNMASGGNALATGTLIYKGTDGATLTGGRTHKIFYTSQNYFEDTINVLLKRGDSFGITINPNTSGGCNVHAVLIGHLRDGTLD
jgi:hypothetical protein